MGKNLGKFGYVDISFEKTLEEVKKKCQEADIFDNISERQATKIIAAIMSEIDYKIILKAKKRKDKIEIKLL